MPDTRGNAHCSPLLRTLVQCSIYRTYKSISNTIELLTNAFKASDKSAGSQLLLGTYVHTYLYENTFQARFLGMTFFAL